MYECANRYRVSSTICLALIAPFVERRIRVFIRPVVKFYRVENRRHRFQQVLHARKLRPRSSVRVRANPRSEGSNRQTEKKRESSQANLQQRQKDVTRRKTRKKEEEEEERNVRNRCISR